jgi:hypothetical protein
VGRVTDCEVWRYSRDGFGLRFATEVTTITRYTVRRTDRDQLCWMRVLTEVTMKSTLRREAYLERTAMLDASSHRGDYEHYVTP